MDHEAIYTWLDSVRDEERPAFLGRLAALVESLLSSPGAPLEPDAVDRACSYAILMEYAAARGVSPAELGWVLGTPVSSRDESDELSVDDMLSDARGRRSRERRAPEVRNGEMVRVTRGLTLASRLPGREVESRVSRRADVRVGAPMTAPGRVG